MNATTLALLLTLVTPSTGTIDEQDAVQAPQPVAYYTTREQQILIHGAGGCTPNFSTGGCL